MPTRRSPDKARLEAPALGWHEATPKPFRDCMVQGDAFELATQIPDESVDFAFTDPDYSKVDDYAALAGILYRVMRPNTSALIWCPKPKLGSIRALMEAAGLVYVYDLSYVVVAKSYRMRFYNLFCWTTPCLWMQKGISRPYRWLPDTFLSKSAPMSTHKWNKNMEVILEWLDAFTLPGHIVYDPFGGDAPVAVAAKQLQRHFITSELDSTIAQGAAERIRKTRVQKHVQRRLLLDPELEPMTMKGVLYE